MINNQLGIMKSIEHILKEDQVVMNVTLGMPSKGCNYHGICKIEELSTENKQTSNCKKQVKAAFRKEQNRLIMYIGANEIDRKLYEFYFASGYFIVLESFDIPESLKNKIEISYTIQQGVYRVSHQNDYLKVTF